MFRQQFPAVIISGGELRIRTSEKRDVVLIPIPILIVPEGLRIQQSLFVEDRGGRRVDEENDQGSTNHKRPCLKPRNHTASFTFPGNLRRREWHLPCERRNL